ncbi:23360_t:CDS:1, partial [Gigaspora margarita]
EQSQTQTNKNIVRTINQQNITNDQEKNNVTNRSSGPISEDINEYAI